MPNKRQRAKARLSKVSMGSVILPELKEECKSECSDIQPVVHEAPEIDQAVKGEASLSSHSETEP